MTLGQIIGLVIIVVAIVKPDVYLHAWDSLAHLINSVSYR